MYDPGQTTGLNHLRAHFLLTGVSILTAVSILTVVYPKVVLTAVFILTVVSSSLSDNNTVHFYFNAYVNKLGRNDLINALIN